MYFFSKLGINGGGGGLGSSNTRKATAYHSQVQEMVIAQVGGYHTEHGVRTLFVSVPVALDHVCIRYPVLPEVMQVM